MKHLILVAMVALAGCSVDNTEAINSTTHEQTDANGLTLLPSQEMYVTFADISNYYSETMSCMGMTADGPDVEFKSFEAWYLPPTWALYHPGGLVMVNTDHLGLGFDRDKRTDTEALKHEFVHHILNMNGADWHHGDPMFELCGIGVNTYN